MTAATPDPIAAYPHDWLRQHLDDERRRTALLGETREAVFGAQDGLVSTLGVVTAVGAATGEIFPVLVAGLASALAGMFSMAIGEYTGSKSQREIYEREISDERDEVEERPHEAQAEVAFMLEEEGLDQSSAREAAAILARSPEVLLKTMVEKEHGIAVEEGAGPLRGAFIMGAAFGIGSVVPVVPFLFLPVTAGTWLSAVLTAIALFAIGWTKSRWTHRSSIGSGLELVVLAAAAGIAGYVFGTLVPKIFGVAVGG